MAESVNPLVLPIKVDTSQVATGVQALRNRLNELRNYSQQAAQGIAQTGNASLTASTGLAQLGNQAAATTNQLNQLTNSSVRVRTTLTSLSLVAQDAPFGFIAIQNNLPALIQQFGLLRAESTSNADAFKKLALGIAGPAGAFLAFSVLTSAVTFAIREYGSLRAAINAITGNTNEFTKAISKANKSLAEYNKNAKSNIELRNDAIGSVEDEIIKVNSLADVLRNSTSSDRQKQGALSELKKANDEYFGKLNAQKIDLESLNESVKLYTESLIKNKVAQNLASEAAGVFTEFLKQNQIAVDISQQINKLTEQYPNLTKRVKEYFDTQERIAKQGGVPFGPSGEVKRYIELNDQLKAVNVNVKSTANSYNTLKTQADAAFKAASSFLDLGKDGKEGGIKVKDILKLDSQELDEAFNLKDIKSKVNEYGNILLNVNNTEKQRKDALKELIAINPEFANTLSLNKSRLNENKTAIQDNIRALNVLIAEKEFNARASAINTQFNKLEQNSIESATKAEIDRFEELVKLTYAQDNLGNSTDKLVKKNNDYLNSLKEVQDLNEGVIEILNKGLNLENTFNKNIESLLNFEKYTNTSIQNIARNLRFLQEPLEGLLTTSLEGASANWKEFADDVIKQIKRITAALLAKALITGIANILAPGTGSLVSSGFEGISDETLLDFLDNKIKNPSFGGVGGGGMEMSGQVVFVQRGSDLVGVLNRTNSTINRVG